MQKCIWFASVSQDRLLQLLTLECCMFSVLAKHFVQPVKPSSCLGKTVGCGGCVFLLSTRIYRKPFHRTGVFLESDQSSPGIILRLTGYILGNDEADELLPATWWQSPRETLFLAPCHLCHTSVYWNASRVAARSFTTKGALSLRSTQVP